MIPWVFITILSVTPEISAAHLQGYQTNEAITVALGDTITLQCSVKGDTILWYQQIAGYQPQIISVFQKKGESNFYAAFQNGRFQRSNFNLKILNIIQSDEAVYHCGSRAFYVTFGRGTHLMIKGQKESSTTASTVSKSHYLNDSIICQQICHENSTKQVKTEEQLYPVVFGLAVALGHCGVLIIILMCLIFKREMCQQCLTGASGQDGLRGSSGAQETDDENLTYAALRFSRKKVNLEKREQSQRVDFNII